MAIEARAEDLLDPAARGFNGRLLSPVDPPGPTEPPSREWLAQIGRAASGEYLNGRPVLKRLTEDGLSVPGNDPLYQHLGVHRLFAEVIKTQHDEQLACQRAMLVEARQGLAQLLADVSAAGAAAVVARRAEDDAALKRFSAELDAQAESSTRKMREALAEERIASVAAIEVKVADVMARIGSMTPAGAGHGFLWQSLGFMGPAWAARCRTAAACAAVLAVSVIVGLALLWTVKH